MTKEATPNKNDTVRKNKYIPVITRGYSRKIPIEDVIYIKQVNRKLIIVTELGTFASYEKLENIEGLLDWRFQHAIKKLVINIEKITLAQKQIVTFSNGDEMELGREGFIRIKQRYNAYLKKLVKSEDLKGYASGSSISVDKVDMLEVAKGKSVLRKEIVNTEKNREGERQVYIDKLKKEEKL